MRTPGDSIRWQKIYDDVALFIRQQNSAGNLANVNSDLERLIRFATEEMKNILVGVK